MYELTVIRIYGLNVVKYHVTINLNGPKIFFYLLILGWNGHFDRFGEIHWHVIFFLACHILECSDGLAQDVISTIGQAFDLRFQLYLQCPSSKPSSMHDRWVFICTFRILILRPRSASHCVVSLGLWVRTSPRGRRKERSPPIITTTTAFPERCRHQEASLMLDWPIRRKTAARSANHPPTLVRYLYQPTGSNLTADQWSLELSCFCKCISCVSVNISLLIVFW